MIQVKGMNRQVLPFVLAVLLPASGLPAAGTPAAEIPGPDHTFYGTPAINGVLVEAGVVTLTLNDDSNPVASYVLGSEPENGSRYVLRIPMGFGAPRSGATARDGDSASLYVDGVIAGEAMIGEAGRVTVLDLDTFFNQAPELSIDGVTVTEGDSGSANASLTVHLSRAAPLDVTFDFVTEDDTAVAPGDYTAVSSSGVVLAGDTSATVSVLVVGETVVEPPESFFVVLQNPSSNAALAAGQDRAAVVIDADDAQFVTSIADLEVVEGDGGGREAVFTVVVDSQVPGAGPVRAPVYLAVDYQTLDGTALADEDYQPDSGTLSIDLSTDCPDAGLPCGEITVSLVGDNRREPSEDFVVELLSPTLGILGQSQGRCTIFDDEVLLRFVEAELDGPPAVTGLRGAVGAAFSPGGEHLYVASQLDDALAVFERDPATGEIVFVEEQSSTATSVVGLGGVEGVTVSPDGAHVYAASYLDDSLVVLARDPATGALSFVERQQQGAGGVAGLDGALAVAVSPDGAHVYAAGNKSNAVEVFARDPVTGGLTAAPGAGAAGLTGVLAVTVTGDGAHVLVASSIDSTVTVFEREPATGVLTLVDQERDGIDDASDAGGAVDGLNGALALALAPDGAFVYAVGQLDNAVAVFSRDASTGELSFVERKKDGFGPNYGLAGVSGVAMGSGDHLVVSSQSESSVSIYARDPETGRLTWLETRHNGEPDLRGPLAGLGGATGLAVSADGESVAVAGNTDDGVALFALDFAPPALPAGLVSTSHTPGTWSNDPELVVQWDSGTDLDGGPLSGYSFLVDMVADTDPGLDLDLGWDPAPATQSTQQTLTDGDGFYFHLRTCDLSDNCSEPVHLGPFRIDATPPSAVAGLTSPSHTPGVAWGDDTVDVSWTAASDAPSGVDGYAIEVDQSAAWTCDGVTDLTGLTTTTAPLADSSWYVHVCALDMAGNASPVTTAGPFVVDTVPPSVVAVGSVSAADDGQIDDGDAVRASLTQLHVAFSREMNDPGGDFQAGDVSNPASYLLYATGGDRTFETTDCAAGVAPSDVAIAVDRTAVTLRTVYLWLDAGLQLSAGRYRLRPCAVLTATTGTPLDGNGDGVGGDDHDLAFTVLRSNLLLNPNFDEDLTAWSSGTALPTEVVHDGIDADGAPTSGSVKVENLSGSNSVSFHQCVPLSGERKLTAEGKVRIAAAGTVDVTIEVGYHDSVDCTGSTVVETTVQTVTPGLWTLHELATEKPAGARSATVRWTVIGTSFEAWIDNLFFGATEALFVDGFESGDVSMWSTAVP